MPLLGALRAQEGPTSFGSTIIVHVEKFYLKITSTKQACLESI